MDAMRSSFRGALALAASVGLTLAGCGGKECVVPPDQCGRPQCIEKGATPASGVCDELPTDKCYTYAICEVQEDGTCGWTQTVLSLDCLQNQPSL